MKRFIYHGKPTDLPTASYDVVIVGSGLAGIYAALNVDPQLRCIVLDKRGEEESNTHYAQGGVAAAVTNTDSPECHLQDTLVAGAGLCDDHAVRILVTEGPRDINRLIEWKVPFDVGEDGKLLITREGAHSQNRILHSGGDATGLHIINRLLELAHTRPNLSFAHQVYLMDIVKYTDGSVAGVTVFDGECKFFAAPHVILATGGIGRIYRNSTNAQSATGDGIAAAMRCGAAVKDMEFVQFHPTALTYPDATGRYFLISEALRGEGAVLRNRRWEPFMKNVHPLSDLAPRDIVSRAIVAQMIKDDIPNVYLDITTLPREYLSKRFPTIYQECMSRGIDIAKEWIPVIPVQHYFMGGIQTDTDGRTNVPGLYACGECSCTGVHGANRLASNSLLECLVFGRRSAESVNHAVGSACTELEVNPDRAQRKDFVDFDSFRTEIRDLMTKKGGILRNAEKLTEAISRIGNMVDIMSNMDINNTRGLETYNMSLVALAILHAALARPVSVGAHYRTDDQGGKQP